MKFSNRHIFSLIAALFTFLLFTSKADGKATVAAAKETTVTNQHINPLNNKGFTVAFIEEINISHSDQQKEDVQKYTVFQSKVNQNHSLHIPALDISTKAVFNSHTKKQQLLNIIFPSHFFY
ncbi:hypothetical protein NBRC110019_21870 [Neptunitalea chrysea]|uniref:Uncharacterized protein n=1 Tax=Neptunitalea chrysea TaxID=1647581 RepID=A0A9W6B7C0_9FLAO|nr:hypothetical protein [Neptunitalea chrysea]GLB53147.1 hypothetical protein NBRC110019_21870 [Neptunitalea chrysea]